MPSDQEMEKWPPRTAEEEGQRTDDDESRMTGCKEAPSSRSSVRCEERTRRLGRAADDRVDQAPASSRPLVVSSFVFLSSCSLHRPTRQRNRPPQVGFGAGQRWATLLSLTQNPLPLGFSLPIHPSAAVHPALLPVLSNVLPPLPSMLASRRPLCWLPFGLR